MDTSPTRTSWLQAPGGAEAGGAAGRPAAGAPASGGEREKIAELAREFEAYFVLQLVRQMRQSMLDNESGEGLGASTMTDTLDVELGQQLAKSGGIGLAQVLQTAIERQVGVSTSPAASAYRAIGAPTPVSGSTVRTGPVQADPVQAGAVQAGAPRAVARQAVVTVGAAAASGGREAALPLPVAGAHLTSAYGWRHDPLDGATRFHAGVDIRAAYGREVPAAGAGEIVFSGVQGGYGNTVVIEHSGGVRTRYGHLSSIQVEAGQRVEAGTVIGRVGSSGRSTGPHLHFEVLQDGRPVNPEAAATRYAGQLKVGGLVADLPISQPSLHGVAAGVDDEDSGQ